MIILFDHDRLARDCNDHNRLLKTYGKLQAKKIEQRLSELASASCLEDMKSLPGRCHELTGDLKGYFAIDLVHPTRLLMVPANKPMPLKPDGGIDWSRVSEIRIVRIEDYHD